MTLILLFGFHLRWKNLQSAVLVFCAIHQKIKDNPPSGSSPSDWLADAKQAYYDEEGRQFVFERAWNLLKNKAIFINLANKGKAKNGRRISLASNTLAVSSSPSPAPANCSENPTESVTVGRDVNWKRPAGAKAEKRKIDKNDFRQKKLKLLKKSNNNTALRIAEARRANDIQDKLAIIDQNKSDRLFMLQSLDDCPDEEAREFFLLRQKDIVDCVRNPTQSTACSSSRTQATSHPPEPSSETNGLRDVNDDSSDEGNSIHQSNPQSKGQSESDLPWLDPDLA
jgi:hypothetical protein